jgi:glycerol-3-phosphate dehydrogenase (NAD(P)+)
MEAQKIAVIGGGSWATALVKILCENLDYVGWWVRSKTAVDHIRKFHHNPRYLSSVELPTEVIDVHDDLQHIVNEADILLFAIPSAFLKPALESYPDLDIRHKMIISAIKGIVPDERQIVGEYFHNHFQVPMNQIGVITGPCHAEEVALERLSYLTVASQDPELANLMADALSCDYIRVEKSDDIYGTEYAAVLKNVYAVASGICHGLGYGDNFQAVLVSNAIREMKRFIRRVHPIKRDINGSAYLGDLLVTAYSQFSRNRQFGTMVGKGYTIRSAQLEMSMVAEGYYATRLVELIRSEYEVKMPVAKAVYRILYEGRDPKKTMARLAQRIH